MADNSFNKMLDRKEPNPDNTENNSSPEEDEEAENEVQYLSSDLNDEEIASLNNQLDQLNNALDLLEQKNDNIHSQLMELLHSNRQARLQFQELQLQEDAPSSDKKA